MLKPLRDDLMVQQQLPDGLNNVNAVWQHMVAVIMLNQTGRKPVKTVLPVFLDRWRTPGAFYRAFAYFGQEQEIRDIIWPLGMGNYFRAAAVEQVKVWGERSQVEVIANPGKNTDPAAVVYDGIEAAKSREIELLLVDTAGRLQNKKNLMAELSKIRRIIDKKAESAVVESLLVLDATLGQNGLRQAEVFSEAAQLSGVILTKIDGTAKGGVALAVARQLNLPIRFVGAGEGIEDLRPFSSYEFVEALLSGD